MKVTQALTTRLGPFPVWVWALIIGGGFLAFKALSGGSAPTGGESVITNTGSDQDETGGVQLLPIAQAGPSPTPSPTPPPIDGRGSTTPGRGWGLPGVLSGGTHVSGPVVPVDYDLTSPPPRLGGSTATGGSGLSAGGAVIPVDKVPKSLAEFQAMYAARYGSGFGTPS